MDRHLFAMMIAVAAGACTTPTRPAPSLAPRAAETIDPRVPIPSEIVMGPVTPAIAARLADLTGLARSGDAAFSDRVAAAERLAEGAGPPQSESWVAAQQALSTAQAAREPTTRALGDIDAMAATDIATRGGIPAADLAAIQSAAAEVAAIDRRQARRIVALQARLGS